jgi:hypothetical protein
LNIKDNYGYNAYYITYNIDVRKYIISRKFSCTSDDCLICYEKNIKCFKPYLELEDSEIIALLKAEERNEKLDDLGIS